MWIHKCGGTVRLSMSDDVNIVVVEMQKLKNMIDCYSLWHAKQLEIYNNNSGESINDRAATNSNAIIQPRNKREQILLGVH